MRLVLGLLRNPCDARGVVALLFGNLKCDSINVALGDANSSALITIPEDTDFKYVVMPMRI